MREIDPKISGPGAWMVTHVLAMITDQSGHKKDYTRFSLFVYRMIHAFPCRVCRRHAVRYLDNHPTPASRAEGSAFEWSFTFHNTVNKRLGKKVLTLQEATPLYENTEVILNDKATGATCSLNPSGESGCEDTPL